MKEIVVILDNVRSVLNVGAILRTCDGAGVKKLYLAGITPEVTHKKIAKTALGAEAYVKSEHVKSAIEVVEELKKEGFEIISVEQTSKSEDYSKVEYSDKVCLIFGNEISGVSSELLDLSNKVVELPMFGKKNSLNVATTVGIVVYHVVTL